METSLRLRGASQTQEQSKDGLRIHAKEKLRIASNALLQAHGEIHATTCTPTYLALLLRNFYPRLSANLGLGLAIHLHNSKNPPWDDLTYTLRANKAIIPFPSNALLGINLKGRLFADKYFNPVCTHPSFLLFLLFLLLIASIPLPLPMPNPHERASRPPGLLPSSWSGPYLTSQGVKMSGSSLDINSSTRCLISSSGKTIGLLMLAWMENGMLDLICDQKAIHGGRGVSAVINKALACIPLYTKPSAFFKLCCFIISKHCFTETRRHSILLSHAELQTQ